MVKINDILFRGYTSGISGSNSRPLPINVAGCCDRYEQTTGHKPTLVITSWEQPLDDDDHPLLVFTNKSAANAILITHQIPAQEYMNLEGI